MRRGFCVHFMGSHQDKPCAAGVDYRARFGADDGIACRAPCIQEYKTHEKVDGKLVPTWKPWPRHGHQEMPCELRLMPTAEQIEADSKEWDAVLARMRLIVPLVNAWRTWTKKNRVAKQEIIECPTCKGRLHLSQSAHNGHVWGKCETAKCIEWME